MVKKIMLALLIVILLCAVGIVSLILLVNPNHFRQFISDTVKEKTGYLLTIKGDLRWHVWPQVSILTGAIRLEDEGAQTPLLTADNMRLDVAIWSLFHKKLDVKTVFVKSATVNVSKDSRGKRHQLNAQKQAPATGAVTSGQGDDAHSHWSYALKRLELADSTFIIQIGNKEQLNFRNIDFTLNQKNAEIVFFTLKGLLNRDQRDFRYDIEGTAGIHDFPDRMPININRFNYKIDGIGLPQTGLSGNMTAAIAYQKTPLRIQTRTLMLALGESALTGKIGYYTENNRPRVLVQLEGDTLDLTPFSGVSPKEKRVNSPMAPVMVTTDHQNEFSALTDFDAEITVKVRQILTNTLTLHNANFHVTNRKGVAELNPAVFDMAHGHVTLFGRINGNTPKTYIELQTSVSNLALGDLLKSLAITDNISGTLQGKGIFKTDSLRRSHWLTGLTGDVDFSIKKARLNNLNMQQIIQMAVAQVSKDAVSSKLQEKYTEFHELAARGDVNKGILVLNPVTASSETLNASGQGRIDLVKQNADVRLNVKILSGWNEKSETIARLQKVIIPLRIYGPLSQLHYQVDLNKILQEQWQKGLNKLKEKYLSYFSPDA